MEVTGYAAEVSGEFDVNVLAAATQPGASIEMSLTTASGDKPPILTAQGVSVDWNDVSIEIPRMWSIGRQFTNGNVTAPGMLPGENTLEIVVASDDGTASRSYIVELNRLAPDPNAEGDPECPEPALDALLEAVSAIEPRMAQ